MLQEHQVKGEHAQQALLHLRRQGAGCQGCPQEALEPGVDALGLRPLAIGLLREGLLHLPPVARLWQPSTPSQVQSDDALPYAQLFSTEAMVAFGVVSGIRQQLVKPHKTRRLARQRLQHRTVVARAQTHVGGQHKMRARVAQDAQLRPPLAALGAAGPVVEVVEAGLPGVQPCAVDDALERRPKASAALGQQYQGAQQRVKSPFFTSRSWA